MDITKHTDDIRKRNPRPYRAHMLHLLTYAHADEAGVWEPPSKVWLRRALAHQGQGEGQCRPHEVTTAIKHAVSQGVLSPASTEDRLILSGSVPTIEENNR